MAGVHADGDKKDNLYQNELVPERFGRRREYALGKNSGKANIIKNLEELGLVLTPEQTRRVTQRITELGDKKETVTQEDLPFIVADVLKHSAPEDKVKLKGYMVSLSLDRTFPLLSNYAVTIPPGGRTDALVQTVITWNDNGKTLRTRGLDADQTEAAIKATFKMLNIIENEYNNQL